VSVAEAARRTLIKSPDEKRQLDEIFNLRLFLSIIIPPEQEESHPEIFEADRVFTKGYDSGSVLYTSKKVGMVTQVRQRVNPFTRVGQRVNPYTGVRQWKSLYS
jgi:hypothetical protein